MFSSVRYFSLFRSVFFILLVCGLGFCLALPAYANGLAVKVQPSTIDEKADPGQVLEGTLTVTNENGGRQTYFISTRNVIGMNDSGTPDFSKDIPNDPLEAAYWIQPSLDSITLDVGESVGVPYKIVVPESASPGSYFAAFFITREADESVENGAGVGFNVASLVNLRISGEVIEDMQFREFYTDKTFYTEPSVVFKANIENTGTVHQRPRGLITISDMFGNEVGKATFNDSTGAILPRFDRVFETAWNHDGFVLGRYTANASILFGETSKKTLSRELTFWVLPLKEIGIVFGGIAVLLFMFMYGVKRYVRNMLKKAGQETLSENKSNKISFAKRMVRTTSWLLVILALLFIGMVVFFA